MPNTKLDAAALAERMNALPDATIDGQWIVGLSWADECDHCQESLFNTKCVAFVRHNKSAAHVCLPCALAECERAESTTTTEME